MRYRNPWLSFGLQAASMMMEASTVMALRTIRISMGGAAGEAEARKMVEEKVQAGVELATLAATGGLGTTPLSAATKTLAHYRRKVRANNRRLKKG
jgi:hypothetical protein